MANEKLIIGQLCDILFKVCIYIQICILMLYHFNLWKEGKGNFVICAMKAMEISKTLFESKISESGALKQECIYQRAFDEIEESLEDFRIKIYWSQKKEPVKRIPVIGRMVNFEDEE